MDAGYAYDICAHGNMPNFENLGYDLAGAH